MSKAVELSKKTAQMRKELKIDELHKTDPVLAEKLEATLYVQERQVLERTTYEKRNLVWFDIILGDRLAREYTDRAYMKYDLPQYVRGEIRYTYDNGMSAGFKPEDAPAIEAWLKSHGLTER